MNSLTRIKDEIVNKLIIENLLQKGKVTIEEAQFFNTITNKVVDDVFKPVIEEAMILSTQNTQNVQQETNESTSELTEEKIIKKIIK